MEVPPVPPELANLPKWDHKEWNHNSRRYLAAVTTIMILSTIAFILRIFSRRRAGLKLWWDDYFAGVALLLSYAPNIDTAISIHYGLGWHAVQVTPEDVVQTLKIAWIEQVTWQFAMPFIKFSLLFLYRRLFPTRWIYHASMVIGIFVLGWLISTTVVQIMACQPVAYYWDRTIPGGTCLNYNLFYIITGAINMVTDAVVLILPIPIVWGLQISRSQKIGLSFAFLVGSFTCAASIARMALLPKLNPFDITYSAVDIGIWGCIEVSAGVISCNVPACAPLFIVLWKKIRGDTPHSTKPDYKGYALGSAHHRKYNNLRDYGRSGKKSGMSVTEGFSVNDTYDDRAFTGHDDTLELQATRDARGGAMAPPGRIHVRNDVEQSATPYFDRKV